MTLHRTSSFARSLTMTTALAIAAVIAVSICAYGQAPASSEHAKPETTAAPAKTAAGDSATAVPVPPASPEAERQARLVADTARLYKLAQELKIEVDKSSKDQMSLAVIKKAAEVEELARDLKERLKTSPPKAK
jgi:hypothetical protein